MNLLSSKDFDSLEKAMRRGDEICMVREMKDLEVTAKTCAVTYPWTVPMVVQIQVKKGQYSWSQSFETIEEAKQGLTKGYGVVFQVYKILGGN